MYRLYMDYVDFIAIIHTEGWCTYNIFIHSHTHLYCGDALMTPSLHMQRCRVAHTLSREKFTLTHTHWHTHRHTHTHTDPDTHTTHIPRHTHTHTHTHWHRHTHTRLTHISRQTHTHPLAQKFRAILILLLIREIEDFGQIFPIKSGHKVCCL